MTRQTIQAAPIGAATDFKGDEVNELNDTQKEALLASASKHEQAVNEIRAVVERLQALGYKVYAGQLSEVLSDMISHVDHARELARRP